MKRFSVQTINISESTGHINTSYAHDYTKGFEIFLHEKGQFWPGLEMERIGQSKAIYVKTDTEVRVTFTMIQKTNIPKAEVPCVTEAGYSYSECMRGFIARSAGCHLDWVDGLDRGEMTSAGARCETREELLRYHAALTRVSRLPWTQLTNLTSCHAKCDYKEFSFTKVR